jgi:hypothetical protein
MAAAGAALAAAGTVGFVLVEGVTRPDLPDAERDEALEAFTQTGGFVAVAVASVSAALLLGGGGIVLADVVGSSPAASPTGGGGGG